MRPDGGGLLLAVVAAALAGCGSSETRLRVTVESDLAVPDELDSLRVQVAGAKESFDVTRALSGPFPHAVEVVAAKDPNAQVEVTATGLHEGRAVVSTRKLARFEQGQVTEVVVRLGACASCTDGGPDGGDGDADADADGDADGDGDGDADADVWRPSNLPDDIVPVAPEVEEFAFDVSTRWSTDTGEIVGEQGGVVRAAGEGVVDGIGFQQVSQGAEGPPLGVWSFRRFELGAGATVVLAGAAGGAVVAEDELRIAGVLDAGATGVAPGPGGGAGAQVDRADGDAEGEGAGGSVVLDVPSDPGGGGGGFGGAGGKGGNAEGLAAAGLGGAVYGDEALVPLLGGSGGGAGGAINTDTRSPGGGGGGALQLFSRVRITVLRGGAIVAGGAGGAAGPVVVDLIGGGSGGGSGGALLLEAPEVELAGAVAANGGGGGAGPQDDTATDGEHGRADDTPAAGGTGVGSRAGGDGAAGDVVDGEDGAGGPEGGGGGGGVGRIRANTATGRADVTGVVSPPASEGVLARAR